MSEVPSLPPAAVNSPPARSCPGIALLVVTMGVMAVVAMAPFGRRDNELAMPVVQLDLGAVIAVKGEPEGTVHLRLSPGRVGENRVGIEIQSAASFNLR